jgi:hypothetical protein
MPAAHKTYLTQLVAAHTGLSRADAEKRADDVIAKANGAETRLRIVADAARRVDALVSIFVGLSMSIGAFIAAAAASRSAAGPQVDHRRCIR